MKKILSILIILLCAACSKKDDGRDNNPYLINPLVNIKLNLNLPEYNDLKFPGGKVIIPSQGIKGIVVYNLNNDLYTAFELSDPNHAPNDCSRMTVEGIVASCPCESDTNEYDIVTGQPTTGGGKYPMQQYNAQRNGNDILISN